RRRPRSLAAQHFGESCRVAMHTPFAPRIDVVADDRFLLPALFDGHRQVAGHGETRITAAHRLTPEQPWRLGFPITGQGRPSHDAIALPAAVLRKIGRLLDR